MLTFVKRTIRYCLPILLPLLDSFLFVSKKLLARIFNKEQKYYQVIPCGARFCNHLYFFLHAYKQRLQGKNTYIHYIPNMESWLKVFPKLNTLVLRSEEINKFIDYRIRFKNNYYQNYTDDFTQEELVEFIREFLINDIVELSKSFYSNKFILENEAKIILHLRRGDFYSEANISYYGFDQVSYIKSSLNFLKLQDISKVYIATDDIQWCKNNLSFLSKQYGIELIFPNTDQINDFLFITQGDTLVLSNSTFAYWAAYINEIINPNSLIIAPNFNTKLMDQGKMRQNSKKWQLIDVKVF